MGTPGPSAAPNLSPRGGLLRGLTWITEHLDEFAIARRMDLTSPNLKDNLVLLKPISELALTIWLLERCGIHHELSGHLADWIWQQTEKGKLLTRLLLARADFLPCCSLYASLSQLGYRAEHLDRVLSMLATTDMAQALPLPRWGALALDYNLSLLGLSAQPERLGNSLYTSALPEPWVVSGELGYAITHEVFYLTDFGFAPLENHDVAEYLRLWVPYWAQVFVEEGDHDLAGEFAMVWRCIGIGSSSMSDPLGPVLSAQTEDGYVQGPEGAGTVLFRPGDDAARRVFLGRYHTTLVAMMAYALELRHSPE